MEQQEWDGATAARLFAGPLSRVFYVKARAVSRKSPAGSDFSSATNRKTPKLTSSVT
jgi:hypothetical protein